MAVKTISPSPNARQLFGQMVARAPVDLHLRLADTLELAVERSSAGNTDASAIDELVEQEWIEAHEDGGWLLH